MRLKPPVSADEVQTWLREQVVHSRGEDVAAASRPAIERIAADMVMISAADVPERFEPLATGQLGSADE